MRDNDTKIGGRQTAFPATRKSAVYAAASADPAQRKWAVETIVAAYWKPAYNYIRLKWGASNEDAKDLTQAFFTALVEKEFLKNYDPARASFRTYLRTCMDHFVANAKKSAATIKRGGQSEQVPLDSDAIEADTAFEREWVRTLFGLALETLQQECERTGKMTHFRLFEHYDLEESSITYADLAAAFDLPVTDVTNHLAWTRRQFRRILLEQLKQMTGSDREFQREARILLGMSGCECKPDAKRKRDSAQPQETAQPSNK